MSASTTVPTNTGTGSGFTARPSTHSKWAHLLPNDHYITPANKHKQWDVKSILDKVMDEAGDLKWVVDWEGSVPCVTMNDDGEMDGCDESMEDFEASHGPSSTDIETHLPGILDQSPYAACTTISELVAEVMEREKSSKVFKKWTSQETLRSVLFAAFASMDADLLDEIVRGNISRRRYCDREFRTMTDTMRSERKNDPQGKRPAHYMFEFTDEHGKPPTNAEARALLDKAERYIDDPQFAYDTDLEFDDSVDLEYARYFSSEEYTRVTGTDKRRKDVIRKFIQSSRDYLNKWGGAKMLQAWRELGYTHDIEQRLGDHLNWQSSNYLMILMESISFKWFGAKWCNRGELIFECFDRSQADVMEVALTAISGSNLESGHGMSHYEAGRSVESNWRPRDAAVWEAWKAQAFPMVEKNVAVELVKLAKEEEERQKKREYIELQRAIMKRDKHVADLRLLRLEVAMAKLHANVRTVVPTPPGRFTVDTVLEDSDERVSTGS